MAERAGNLPRAVRRLPGRDLRRLPGLGILERGLGLILLHAGCPLVYRSFSAWISTLLWAAFIATWTRFEEKALERRFGEEYRRYRQRTWF